MMSAKSPGEPENSGPSYIRYDRYGLSAVGKLAASLYFGAALFNIGQGAWEATAVSDPKPPIEHSFGEIMEGTDRTPMEQGLFQLGILAAGGATIMAGNVALMRLAINRHARQHGQDGPDPGPSPEDR